MVSDCPVNLILDSGAFSAWRRREKIKLKDYINFFLERQHLLYKVVNLDQIPGVWGRVPAPDEVEASARKGWKNLMAFRKAGVEAMPVFHQGERLYWLDRMVAEGFDWIGISPANDRTTRQKRIWLDGVFAHLCGNGGYPEVKTHGFGVTALPLIFSYPWYSVDSTTWLLQPSYGKIIIPEPTIDGGYNFAKPPVTVAVTDTRKGKAAAVQSLRPGEHYKTMGEAERAYVRGYVEDMGCDMETMFGHFKYRCELSAIYFMEMMKVFESRPFRPHNDTFFPRDSQSPHGTDVNKWPSVRVFFTVPTSRQHSWSLNAAKAADRLITYFYFMDGQYKSWDWEEYVTTGNITVRSPRPLPREKLETT